MIMLNMLKFTYFLLLTAFTALFLLSLSVLTRSMLFSYSISALTLTSTALYNISPILFLIESIIN